METAVDVGASAPANEAVLTQETPITEAPVAAPSHDDELKSIWDKHHQPRENGRFASRNPVEATEATATDPTAPPVADQTAAPAIEQATPAIDAPLSWSAEQKAKWSTLPPDVQTYVSQREKESHEAISRAGQQLKAYEPIGQVIEQHAHIFQKNGLQPADGINRLLAVNEMLEANPRAAIEQIAKAYGVTLQGQAEQTDNPVDPRVGELESRLAKAESYLTAQQRSAVHAEQNALVLDSMKTLQASLAREIADFAKDKPHFEAVRGIMAGLMQSGSVETLKDAYERAVYADPTIRQSMIAEEQSKAEAKRKADEAERVKNAKKAAGVNLKSSPGSTVSAKIIRTKFKWLLLTRRSPKW